MDCRGIRLASVRRPPSAAANYKFVNNLENGFPPTYDGRGVRHPRFRGAILRICERTTPHVGPTTFHCRRSMPTLFVPSGLAPAGMALVLEAFDCARDA